MIRVLVGLSTICVLAAIVSVAAWLGVVWILAVPFAIAIGALTCYVVGDIVMDVVGRE